jgi:hypothetical protein
MFRLDLEILAHQGVTSTLYPSARKMQRRQGRLFLQMNQRSSSWKSGGIDALFELDLSR